MYELRYYQRDSLNAIYKHLENRQDNPCVVIPTGGGKTIVFASLVQEFLKHYPETKILVLAHTRELVRQNFEKLMAVWPEAPAGINAASLNERDFNSSVIFASIQSVFRYPEKLGVIHIIIIDEAHMISVEGDGMYNSLIRELREINNHIRVIGMTATPYRMASGPICGAENTLNHICYDVPVSELVEAGYLCKIKAKGTNKPIDTSKLRVRAGEYRPEDVDALVNRPQVIQDAVEGIVTQTTDRNAVLVFCSSIAHAEAVSSEFFEWEIFAPVIKGDMDKKLRDEYLEDFQKKDIKYLVSVNVLTTGFDATHVDCIAMLRPTKSPGLFYQTVGRGLRIDPSKEYCLVLDFVGNIFEHGPIDMIRPRKKRKSDEEVEPPVKQCDRCMALVPPATKVCQECGFEFPVEKDKAKHEGFAKAGPLLKSDIEEHLETIAVDRVFYYKHKKPGKTPTLRVEYYDKVKRVCSEWVCLEHQGFAYNKAWAWWKARDTRIMDNPLQAVKLMPSTIDDALIFLPDESFLHSREIIVDFSGKYPEIKKHVLHSRDSFHPNGKTETDSRYDDFPSPFEEDACGNPVL